MSNKQYSSIGSDNGLAPAGDKPLSEAMMVSLLTHICISQPQWVNSLALVRYGCNFKLVILVSKIDVLSIPCEIALRLMLQDLADYQSTLDQVMA